MINLVERLKETVQIYAILDEDTKTYRDKGHVNHQAVEAHLTTIFSEYLTQGGLEPDIVDGYCRKLRFIFHPDKYASASPETKWLMDTLGAADPLKTSDAQTEVDGATLGDKRTVCFNLISLCAETIKNPPPVDIGSRSDIFEDCDTVLSFIEALTRRRSEATTFTQRAIIDSIISMLQSAQNYRTTTSTTITPGFMQKLMRGMPYITTGVCMGLYIKELSLLYAVLGSISIGGGILRRTDSHFLRFVGQKMQEYSKAIMCATSVLMTLVVRANIGAFYIGIEASAKLYNAIVAKTISTPSSSSGMSHRETSEPCTTLALAPQDLLGGMKFETLPLKFSARTLELYQRRLEQQYLPGWRAGAIKKDVITAVLIRLQEIDQSDRSLEEKLIEAEKVTAELAKNKYVNVPGSHAAEAISITRKIIDFLCKDAGIVNAETPKSLAYDGRSLC
jgi:hypothetical protein